MPSTEIRTRGTGALALLLLVSRGGALAQDPPSASPVPGASDPGATSPALAEPPWLAEVRAQRQAWEERRRAARDAFEARRRQVDPRRAAHQDAWEEDVRRRREARLQRIDQDRERFRDLGQPTLPWYPGPMGIPDTTGATPGERTSPSTGAAGTETRSADTGAALAAPGAPASAPPLPQAWDNTWYFRGY